MVRVKKKNLLGNKPKGDSTLLPGEGVSEGRWMLGVANRTWTQQEERGKYVSSGHESDKRLIFHICSGICGN